MCLVVVWRRRVSPEALEHRTFTFSMQALLLIQNDELAVLVGLLQDVLALLDVAVVVFQAEEGGHQRHIGLHGIRTRQHRRTFPQFTPVSL